MADQEIIIEQPHSCEISINAKGHWSGKIKVYAETSETALKLAQMRAEQLQEKIKQHNKPPA